MNAAATLCTMVRYRRLVLMALKIFTNLTSYFPVEGFFKTHLQVTCNL